MAAVRSVGQGGSSRASSGRGLGASLGPNCSFGRTKGVSRGRYKGLNKAHKILTAAWDGSRVLATPLFR